MQAAAFVWVMITLEHTGTTLNGWSLLPPFVLAGVGMMVLIMPQTSITLAEIPTTEAGAASGTLTTFGQVGMVFGIALSGTAYFGAAGDSGQNVTAGLWVIVIAYTVSGLAALTMPTRSSQEQPSPDPNEPG
jgi:transporter